MKTNVTDTRDYKAMSEADADKLFTDYARIVLQETAIAAKADHEVAKIRQETETRLKPMREDAEVLKHHLERYMQANPERFESPRYRKTTLGKFGVQSVRGKLTIDEDTVLAWARRHKRTDLFVVSYKLIVDALRTALANGEEIPGCVQQPGGVRINLTVDGEAIAAVKREAEEA